MSDKTFIFSADRHGREDNAKGDIYIGAGDEIYTVDNQENAENITEHETGIYGNAENKEDVATYAAGELNDRFSDLSERYQQVYIAKGNHEHHLIPNGIVESVAENFENIEVLEDELVKIEGQNFYFGKPFQQNTIVEEYYDGQADPKKADYNEDDLEYAAEILNKQEQEVNLSDIDSILNGDFEEDQNKNFTLRGFLEELPVIGNYVFQPAYSIIDKYWGGESSYSPKIDKTEKHTQLAQALEKYEESIEQKTKLIDAADGPVTFITHGQPKTEEMPYASIETREILEKSNNISAAFTGHFHEGFNGDQEITIDGTPVINPKEGYTIDNSAGALTDYETCSFEGEPNANADPIEIKQNASNLTEEQLRKANQIVSEVKEKADTEEERITMLKERMREEEIPIPN